MKIVVGLGNKGRKYQKTYHNAGFEVIGKMANTLGVALKRKECASLTARASVGGGVILAKPQTYMNNSGQAVASLLAKYQAQPASLLVVYDDIDLPLASLRCRLDGGAGTHNGMRDIIATIDSQDFIRIRIGIGKDTSRDLAGFVLSKYSKQEAKQLDCVFNKVAKAIIEYVESGDKDALLRSINEK